MLGSEGIENPSPVSANGRAYKHLAVLSMAKLHKIYTLYTCRLCLFLVVFVVSLEFECNICSSGLAMMVLLFFSATLIGS